MRRPRRLALVALIPALAAVVAAAREPQPRPQPAGGVAFVGVTVVPMDRDRLIPDQTVIVQGERIIALGPAARTTVPAGVTRVDARGKFLMPGLAEMHAHIPSGGSAAANADAERTLFLYLANGVTTIRGMLGDASHLALRERAARGEILSPRIYTAGPQLNGNSAPTPDSARALVVAQKAAGYDHLKVHQGLSREAFDAIDRAADSVRIPYAGHVSTRVGLARALE